MFKKKREKTSFKYLLLSIILFLVFFAIIFSLISANIRIRQRRAEIILRTEEIKKEIEAVEKISGNLESDIEWIEDDDYLELVAREKLGLKLEGEEVVFITREETKEEEIKEEEKKERGLIDKIKNFFNFF